MRIVLAQTAPTDGDIDGAFARIDALLAIARAAAADVLLLPELFLPGYNRPDLHPVLAQPVDGPWITRLGAMARAADCAIALGWAERDGADVYNAATVIGRTGTILSHYRKIQLFGPMERAGFRPGQAVTPVAGVGGRGVGVLVCYDIEFPGHAARLCADGAEIILVPTANPAGYDHVQEVLVPARAHENAAFVAYANYAGTEGGLVFGGKSLIAGPDARILAAAGAGGPAVLIVDIPDRAASAPGTLVQDYTPSS